MGRIKSEYSGHDLASKPYGIEGMLRHDKGSVIRLPAASQGPFGLPQQPTSSLWPISPFAPRPFLPRPSALIFRPQRVAGRPRLGGAACRLSGARAFSTRLISASIA
jgi:hypothetical protein